MVIKREDRPKLIGLSVALVGVLGYVLLVMVPKLTAAAPHTDAPPNLTAASVSAAAPAPEVGGGDGSTALPDSDEAPVPPPVHRDSFTPPPTSGAGVSPAPVQPAVKPIAAGPAAVPGAAYGPGAPASGPTVVAAPAPPVIPPIELKGVILGEPSVAVLSVNGEVVQRQVGDVIFGGLKLARITDAGICVQQGAKQITVTVGHTMPGAMALAQGGLAPAPAGGR